MYKKFILTLLFLMNSFLYGVVIDQSGKYVIGDNIIESNIGLSITASQVIIDLDQHVVSGANFGIVIQPGVQNVLVYNGAIAGGAQAGISIGANCRGIVLRNLQVSNALKRGIEFLGTSLANLVNNVRLENVIMDRCGLMPSTDAVIFGSFVKDIAFNGVGCIQCGNNVGDVSIIHFENITGGVLNQVITRSCVGGSLKAFDFSNAQGTIFEECFAIDHKCTDPLGGFIGYNLENNTFGSLLRGCVVATCTSFGECIGFSLSSGAQETVFENCGVIQNTGNSFSGFEITSDTTTVHNIISDCNCAQNTATGENEFCIGIFAENSNEGTVQRSIFGYNFSLTGTAVGLLFSDAGTQVDNWSVLQCEFIDNKGVDDASSFGVLTQEGQNNLFIENKSVSNGNIQVNQFKGVPIGSVTQILPSTVNTASAPFSNIAVTT